MRAAMLLVHRYVGLLLALFLVIAGISGSLLAWNEALEAAISPQLFRVTAPPAATRMDPLLLHAQVQARYPDALAARLPLEFSDGRSVLFALRPLSKSQKLANDQVFVDPYTGQTLGQRRWGNISQGMKNLMPFIYRLHYSLALDGIGTVLFGIVALLWTLDCFAGAWLTLPNKPPSGEPARRWPARWWQAWKFRSGSAYKISFNLHRAGGLWTWAMLFVLAWSSVAFNLPQVYDPAMKAVFAHQRGLETIPKLARPKLAPALSWEQALPTARRLMMEQAQAGGFIVVAEKALLYDPQRAIYRYDVRSSHDIRHKGGHTRLVMNADTGALLGLWLPTGAAAGDTLSTWMATLHMAAMWGWPLQLLVCLMGLAVTVLSVTGVHVWMRKWLTKRRAGRLATG